MKELEDYRKAGQELYDKLRLYTFPVAIRYIKDVSEIPERVVRPSLMGQKWSLCQAFTYARRWGINVAMTAEDNFCVPSSVSHQWVKVPWEDLLQSQIIQGWHKDEEAEKRVLSSYMVAFGEGKLDKIKDHKGFIVSPLTNTIIIPDVVLIYGNPAQMTHIIHSLCYEGKYIPQCSSTGFAESCQKGALFPLLTGKPEIVLPGTGDRALSGTTEDEMAIGIPVSLLFYVVDNLFKTGGRLNMGQPIRSLLVRNLTEKLTPGFEFLHKKIEQYKKEKIE
ncbi:MAG: DUF169 domain-containing protein [Candidatus Freyarchaeota archaeon]